MPLTRVAADALPALLIGSGRAVVAAVLAAVALTATRQRLPSRSQWWRLAVVAGGVVAGFPLLTSYALTTAPASHGAVVVGLLPAATAATAVVRTGERVGPRFWTFAALGAVATIEFTAVQGDGLGSLHRADLLLLAAVAAAAIGYAEGGLLARELGAWQTVSWALLLAAPLMLVLATTSYVATAPPGPAAAPAAWLAFAYLSAVSMYLGFFAWYRGLAIGPMARVSQVQLGQPALTLTWSALLLGEHLTTTTVLGGLVVVACAALAVRART